MDKLTLNDIMPLPQYAKERDRFRARIVEHKRARRLTVGPVLSFVFEDRQTLLFQVMEMVRVERIVEPDRIQMELDVYNTLMPTRRELSATMFVELTTEEELRHWLPRLPGVEHHVSLHVGERVIRAAAEGGRSKEDATSSVHYLRFPLTDADAEALRSGRGSAAIVVDHESYLASADLPPDVRASLARDLA